MFRISLALLLSASALAVPGCASTERLDWLETEFKSVESRVAPPDVLLKDRAAVDTIVAIALARYPGLRESLHRARSMRSMADAAGRYDDPLLTLKIDDQPLRRDADLEKSVAGIEQMIPWPGKLALQRDAALGPAEAMLADHRMRERELVLAVKRACFEYFRWSREHAIHHDHLKLLSDLGKLTESRYASGRAPQQDILMPLTEHGMVQNDVYDVERMVAAARIRLNLYMDRAADAPVAVPDVSRTPFTLDVPRLVARAVERRPEIQACAGRLKGARAALDLAGQNTWAPDFFVGVEYMQMRDETDEGAIMLGFNLPWFSGRRSAEADAARSTLAAEEALLATTRLMITMDVREAVLKLQAMDKSLDLLEGELLTRSRQSVGAVRSGYENAQSDVGDLINAERSQRDIELTHIRTLAERETALAELERAVGADLRRIP